MNPQTLPSYMQVEQHIVALLSKGNFNFGDRLPTEHKLMQMFSVSRTTIRRALQLIEAQGIVSRNQGSGTFYAVKDTLRKDTPSTRTLGLINFFFMDYIYVEIIRGIEEEIERAGYSLLIANSNRSEERQFEAIRHLIDQKVSGLIIEPKRNLTMTESDPLVRLFSNTDIPVVTTHWGIGVKRFSTVTLDDQYAGKLAGDYLIGMGHERIAYIYKKNVQASYDRMEGLKNALEAAGLTLDQRYVFSYTDEEEAEDVHQGYVQTLRLYASCDPAPTAIFYFNDNIAIQGYRAFAQLKLRVPEDVSVIGFDDYHISSLVVPPLTTFEHPKYDLGRWTAKILIDEIEYKATALPMKLLFEPRLIERSSVRVLK
ncbi:MAG: GntR family transcriptional regulator [Salinispira sp.]